MSLTILDSTHKWDHAVFGICHSIADNLEISRKDLWVAKTDSTSYRPWRTDLGAQSEILHSGFRWNFNKSRLFDCQWSTKGGRTLLGSHINGELQNVTTDRLGPFSEGTNNFLALNMPQEGQLINFPVIINVHENGPNIQESVLICMKYSLVALLERSLTLNALRAHPI